MASRTVSGKRRNGERQCDANDFMRCDNILECLGRIVKVVALRTALGGLAWQVDPRHYWHDETGGRGPHVMT